MAEEAWELSAALYAFAKIEAEPQCWLSGAKADAGPSYCRACAEKAIAAGKGEIIDGGFEPAASDSCEHCEDCGVVLDYSLTDYGVEAELWHFDHAVFDPLCQDDAYHIARLLDSAPDNGDVLTLARRAVAAIPQHAGG